MPKTWSLGWEDHLDKGMATHYSILALRIPWAEEPDGLQCMGSQRAGHNWSDLAAAAAAKPCQQLRVGGIEGHSASPTAGRTAGTQEVWVGARSPTLEWGRGAESHLPRKDWNPLHSRVNCNHPVGLLTWQAQEETRSGEWRRPALLTISRHVCVTGLLLNQKQASPEKQENQSRGPRTKRSKNKDSGAGMFTRLFNKSLILMFKNLTTRWRNLAGRLQKMRRKKILELEIQRPQW